MEIEFKQLADAVNDAIKKLDIAVKEKEIAEIELEQASPDFWNDQSKAQAKTKRLARMHETVEPWRLLEQEVADIIELSGGDDSQLSNEKQAAIARYQALHGQLLLGGQYDSEDAVLSIHAGTGGTDAMDWAGMLRRMYVRYAQSQKWKVEQITESAGDEAGIKSVTLEIKGTNAFGLLKSEHGVHRLVRLSPFNSDNLRQTSFALVEITPLIDEPGDIEIDDKDLRIDVYRAGGHGGQSVNTTDSAVRVTHIPTNIVISIQNERSQIQNKETAMKILRSKLAQLAEEQHAEKMSDIKGPDTKAAWGNQIRNYVLHPYNMVKDTRTAHETSDTSAVLDGEISDFVQAYLASQVGK